MLKFFIIVLIISLGNFSWAQNRGLTKLSFEALEDSIQKYAASDYEKGVLYSDAFRLKGKKEKNIKFEGIGLESIAITQMYNDEDIDIARQTFKRYLKFAESSKETELIIRAYLLGSNIEMSVPDGQAALKHLNTASKKAEESKNQQWIEMTYSRMAMIHGINGDKEKSLEIQKKTVAFFAKKEVDSNYTIQDKNNTLLGGYYMVAHWFRQLDQLDSARYYGRLMKKHMNGADLCTQRYYYTNEGEILFKEKKYKEARLAFDKNRNGCTTESPLYDLNMAYRYGKIEFELKDYDKTISILKKALDDYGVKSSEEGYMDDYYKVLADAYKEKGDYEMANTYFEKYINTKKEFNQIKSDFTASLRDQEVKEFKAELAKLKKDKRAQNSKITFIAFLSASCILVLLILLLRFYRIRKKNEIKFEELLTKLEAAEEPDHLINSKDSELEETSSNDVGDEVTQQILEGLKKLEEQKYYLHLDCNSYNVAKKIKTNTSYLSKVVNQEFEKNFNTYINDLRINYAIVQLKEDKKFRAFSIQSIAEELGYKSTDSFSKYFKLRTGLNPSFYIKQLNSIS